MSGTLVTGASGFVGSRLCRRLVATGVETHAVSRHPREGGGARTWAVDLSDAHAVERLFVRVRPDIVHHLAGYVSGSRSLDAILPSLRDNLVAAVNVLSAAARTGSRVVLAGSMEEPPGESPDEIPASPYAAAKQGVSAFGRMFAALHSVPVVNLRLFMVYGPGQRDHTKLVPYAITSLLRGEPPRLSSGTRPIDWVYVDDVVDAFVAAAVAPCTDGSALDIGSGALVTIREVVERIAEIVGADVTAELGAVPDRPFETIRVADLERARSLLGWQPSTSLLDGLRATVQAFREESISTLHPAVNGTE